MEKKTQKVTSIGTCREKESCALLVGMKTGAATMEKCTNVQYRGLI